ncbi:tetratricopeptide repeat protein [Aureimonas fodinaquatilis]|uniref:Tetratricopeptide repeat protein n=1 Tax=Aureimonas fodinaquatilis TaxID=2565783 RepID=A0A5B0DSY1_9HYPH|nr:tetratricopeptide repeat protein [Aureimonas fodinaquatilis]KAA0969503.1 tetratricopeptide repeat protein [Aureimonas fodinaquatilis]
MNRRRVTFGLVALMLVAGAAAGPSAWGRLFLAIGMPQVAAQLLTEPRWQGVALYQAGRYAEADAAFRKAGRGSTYNRGNSLAATGQYRDAVAYYEAVLYVDPQDSDALANRATIAPLIDPVIGESNSIDGIPATAATGVAMPTIGTYEMNIQALMRSRPAPVTPRSTGQSMVPGPEWLQGLADEPGQYLQLRLAAERQRRAEAGVAAPEGTSPW